MNVNGKVKKEKELISKIDLQMRPAGEHKKVIRDIASLRPRPHEDDCKRKR